MSWIRKFACAAIHSFANVGTQGFSINPASLLVAPVFASKSCEMAAVLGYDLIETKSVKLQRWHNNVLMVSGVAVLRG
jgi:hypothetical protein